MNRQEANRQIVKRITDMVESQPDLRFHQVLNSLGITVRNISTKIEDRNNPITIPDLIHEESVTTLKRMDKGNG